MLKKGLTIVLICVFISGALIFTGCRSHSHQSKAEFMVDYIAETLDLNDPQRDQLDGIKEEFIAKAQEMHAKQQIMHTEFMAELRKRLSEFHQTLSPEQREKLVAKLEYYRKKHEQKWE
jgi:hypothetical protein